MASLLYRCLILMHPPGFRRRFAAEMLWIFEEAAQSTGVFALFLDGFLSLARQWASCSRSWKIAAAVVGAFLQVTAGGLIWVAIGHGQRGARAAARFPAAPDSAALEMLIRLTVGSVGVVALMIVASSLWLRHLAAQRVHASRRLRSS